MNKSNIEVGQPEQQNNNEQTSQNKQVSQPNANTNVVGGLWGQREIKFRSWDGRKMNYNPFISDGSDGGETSCVYINIGISCSDEFLMQYTGLKDKNGKEIYEGDKIKIYAGHKSLLKKEFRIVLLKGAFGFQIIGSDRYEDYSSFVNYADNCENNGFCEDVSNYFEVVGNIFENPELLQTLR